MPASFLFRSEPAPDCEIVLVIAPRGGGASSSIHVDPFQSFVDGQTLHVGHGFQLHITSDSIHYRLTNHVSLAQFGEFSDWAILSLRSKGLLRRSFRRRITSLLISLVLDGSFLPPLRGGTESP